jgi:ParB family chromosome partitioning protein
VSRFVDIRPADIQIGDRLRKVDPDWVDAIAVSMEKIGQQQPVLVAKSGERFKLVAGAHRLAAAKKLKWEKVAVLIVDGTNLELRLHEIDENLLRRELSEMDRAAFLLERKTVWEQIHPESAQGKAGAAARWMQTTNVSFASDAAEKLKLSIRSIQRAIARMKIDGEVRATIANTWIADHGSTLDSLARLSPKEQRRVVSMLLRDQGPAKSVAAALGEINGKPAKKEDHLAKLISAWRKADKRARTQFLEHLEKAGDLTKFVDGRKASR